MFICLSHVHTKICIACASLSVTYMCTYVGRNNEAWIFPMYVHTYVCTYIHTYIAIRYSMLYAADVCSADLFGCRLEDT